jgi:hypothetical protein
VLLLCPLVLCLQAADPLQNLFITGTSCKLLRGAESHAMNEAGENLVPWNGQQDNMIDRSACTLPQMRQACHSTQQCAALVQRMCYMAPAAGCRAVL